MILLSDIENAKASVVNEDELLSNEEWNRKYKYSSYNTTTERRIGMMEGRDENENWKGKEKISCESEVLWDDVLKEI